MQCKTKIGIMRKKYINDLKIDPGESVLELCEEKNWVMVRVEGQLEERSTKVKDLSLGIENTHLVFGKCWWHVSRCFDENFFQR